MYKKIYKRIIDFILAFLGILILLPVFIIISLILLIVNQGNPFFFQKRPGKDEKIFTLVKFKTMKDIRDKQGNLLPDMVRLTKIGAFIRRFSLDEIPNLLNVLIGDMSLIGPRPLFIEYLPLYNEKQSRRHEVSPGITGWAQINGRNTISWKQKFDLDIWYIDNLSFQLDIKIFFLTLIKIFNTEDVNASERETMEWFNGNN